MKKIIALVLVFVCLLLMVGCKKESKEVTRVQEAFHNGMPTKVVVDTVTDFDGTQLLSKAELTIGSYQGKAATVYTHVYQQFEQVDAILTSPIISKQESTEYFEGSGVRTNFISNPRAVFVAGGEDFAPETVDSLIPNLSGKLLTEISFENGVFKATVPKDNAATVFGEGIALSSDATIEILVVGGVVLSTVITYKIPATQEDAPDAVVTATISYYYDVQLLQPLTNE